MQGANLVIFASEVEASFGSNAFVRYSDLARGSLEVFKKIKEEMGFFVPLLVFDDESLVVSSFRDDKMELNKILRLDKSDIFFQTQNSNLHYLLKCLCVCSMDVNSVLFRPEIIAKFISQNYNVEGEEYLFLDIRETFSNLYFVKDDIVFLQKRCNIGYESLIEHIETQYLTNRFVATTIVQSCLFKTEIERMEVANAIDNMPSNLISNEVFFNIQNDCVQFLKYFEGELQENLLKNVDYNGRMFVISGLTSFASQLGFDSVDLICYKQIASDFSNQVIENSKSLKNKGSGILYSYKKLLFK